MDATTPVPPPMGNTGVEPSHITITPRPDWVGGTCRLETYGGQMSERWSAQRILMSIADFFPGSTGREVGGSRHYGRRLQHREFAVMWEGRGDASESVYVEVRGEGWAGLQPADGLELVRYLTTAHRFTASRFDLACDVDGLSTADVEHRVTSGDYQSRAREIVTHRTVKGLRPGGTVEFGAPSSDRRLRLYDYRGPLRIEVQLRRAWATRAVAAVLQAREFRGVWAASVGALVSFASWPGWVTATAVSSASPSPDIAQGDVQRPLAASRWSDPTA